MRSHKTYGYAGGVAAFTSVVLLLGYKCALPLSPTLCRLAVVCTCNSPAQLPASEYALGRITQTSVGIVVYLLVSNLLFPDRASVLLRQQMLFTLETSKQWYADRLQLSAFFATAKPGDIIDTPLGPEHLPKWLVNQQQTAALFGQQRAPTPSGAAGAMAAAIDNSGANASQMMEGDVVRWHYDIAADQQKQSESKVYQSAVALAATSPNDASTLGLQQPTSVPAFSASLERPEHMLRARTPAAVAASAATPVSVPATARANERTPIAPPRALVELRFANTSRRSVLSEIAALALPEYDNRGYTKRAGMHHYFCDLGGARTKMTASTELQALLCAQAAAEPELWHPMFPFEVRLALPSQFVDSCRADLQSDH